VEPQKSGKRVRSNAETSATSGSPVVKRHGNAKLRQLKNQVKALKRQIAKQREQTDAAIELVKEFQRRCNGENDAAMEKIDRELS